MKKLYILSALAALTFTGILKAQTTDYTQYDKSTLMTNPAGVAARSEARITTQYRGLELVAGDQATSMLLTGIYPLLSKDKGQRKGGIGLAFLRDVQGQNESIVVQGLSAAYAYNLSLTANQYLCFGMQGGYFQQKISTSDISTGNQWTNLGGYDPNAPTGESFDRERTGYMTLGAGLNWYKEDESERHTASFGISAFHLNQPDISFTSAESKLTPQYKAQGYMALLKNQDWHIGPEVYYSYGFGLHFYQAGAVARKYFNNRNPFDMIKDGHIAFKAGYREAQYAIVGIALQQPGFDLGLSYDIGVGNEAIPGNAIEVTLSLRKLFKKKSAPAQVRDTEYTLGDVKDFFKDEADKGDANVDGDTNADKDDQPVKSGDYNLALRKDFKFGFNETNLNEEAKAYLDELASLLETHPGTQLEVIGHTDDVGSVSANKKISIKRAEVVVEYLVAKGIDSKRLKATGKGTSEPLVDNNTEENRAKNRRVEFVIYE